MQNYLDKIKNSSRETKLFFFTALLYILPIIVGAVWSYARLDYVRSYDASAQHSVESQNKQSK